MRSRYQKWDAANVFPVAVIWLIFYVITIIGAFTQPIPNNLESGTTIDGAPGSSLRGGIAAWK